MQKPWETHALTSAKEEACQVPLFAFYFSKKLNNKFKPNTAGLFEGTFFLGGVKFIPTPYFLNN